MTDEKMTILGGSGDRQHRLTARENQVAWELGNFEFAQ